MYIEFVNRLASNLCSTADLAVLNDLLDGFAPPSQLYKATQPATVTESNLDSYGLAITTANNNKVGVEIKRRELLDEFLGKFVELLRSSDPNPGIIRSEARVSDLILSSIIFFC